MARKSPDLAGQKFFRLEVLRKGHRDETGKLWWWCKCECGKEFEVKAQRLQAKSTRSCGCYAKERQRAGGKKAKKEGTAFRNVLSYYKHNAKVKGREWELTDEQFRHLVTSPCHYTGALPSIVSTACSGEVFIHNGVDRLDSSKGYTLNNCVPCCSVVNAAKSGIDYESFINMCHTISERFQNATSTSS